MCKGIPFQLAECDARARTTTIEIPRYVKELDLRPTGRKEFLEDRAEVGAKRDLGEDVTHDLVGDDNIFVGTEVVEPLIHWIE